MENYSTNINRRIRKARKDMRVTYWDWKGKVYGYCPVEDAVYIVSSRFSGEQLASFGMKVLVDGGYVKSKTPVKEEKRNDFILTIHCIDRLMERGGAVFSTEEKTRSYITKAVRSACEQGEYFKSGSMMYYCWKQYVFVTTTSGVVVTTVRRYKVHDLCLEIYKSTKTPVPELLISKRIKVKFS